MQIDPRLNEVDDCLYRVAVRVLVVKDNKVLLIKEIADKWWAFPGGGVDHGETIEMSMFREIEEELGVPAKEVKSDFKVVYYDIGSVVNGVPRMNLFYKVTVPENLLSKTSHVEKWGWFSIDEFFELDTNSSYDKIKLAGVIFGD